MADGDFGSVMGGNFSFGAPTPTAGAGGNDMLLKLGYLLTQLSAIPSSFGQVPNPAPQIGNELMGARNMASATRRAAGGMPQAGGRPAAPMSPMNAPAPSALNAPSGGGFLDQLDKSNIPRSTLAAGYMSPNKFNDMMAQTMAVGGNAPVNPNTAPAPTAPQAGAAKFADTFVPTPTPAPQTVAPTVAPAATAPAQVPGATPGTAAPSDLTAWDFMGMTPQMLHAATEAGREGAMLGPTQELTRAQTANALAQAIWHGQQASALPITTQAKITQAEAQAAHQTRMAELGQQRNALLAQGLELKSLANEAKAQGDVDKAQAALITAGAREEQAKAYVERIALEQAKQIDVSEGRMLDSLDRQQKNILTGYMDQLPYLVNLANAKPDSKTPPAVINQAKADLQRYNDLANEFSENVKNIKSRHQGKGAKGSDTAPEPTDWPQKLYKGITIRVSPDDTKAWYKGKTVDAANVDSLFNR